jgi:hypothetical protein
MKTAIIAGLLLGTSVLANAASFESLSAPNQAGGEIIVAVSLHCSNSANLVIKTNANADIVGKGCALRYGDRIVVRWNNGDVVSYPLDAFYAGSSTVF